MKLFKVHFTATLPIFGLTLSCKEPLNLEIFEK